jgi:ribosomal protein S18 acetylase RimI-like enzyme
MGAAVGPPPEVEAEPARPADLDSIAAMMARALLGSPTWTWAFPDPERRFVALRAIWRFDLGSGLPHGWVWKVEDGASASLWYPPGTIGSDPSEGERFERVLEASLSPAEAKLMREVFERFETHHPHEPHYYLSLLATDPDHAGRRLGTALLADNLARIDAAESAAFLETTNPVNLPLYERFGFRPCGEFGLPAEGPTVAQMWRDPARAT